MTSSATVIIALAVAVIAFLQWQTAREKVLLDLFDKRFDIYDDARAAVAGYVISDDHDDSAKLARAALRARFLFGPEVQTLFVDRSKDLDDDILDRLQNPRPLPEGQQRDALEAAHVARLNRLSFFTKDLNKLVAPYMEHSSKGAQVEV